MAITFCDCRAAQLPALRRFWARVYRPDYVLVENEALFRWQFGGADDTFHIKLALLGEEILGCLGYIPVKVSIPGRIVQGAWTANWIVDISKRRLGLGPLLMRELTRQFDITLNIGPNEDARSVLVRMGWTSLGSLTRYVRVLDVSKAALLTESESLNWPDAIKRDTQTDTSFEISPIERFDVEADTLWDRLELDLGSGARRSKDYLNWRYAEHPVWEYRRFAAHQGGKLSGFAVYHVEKVRDLPVSVGRMVEFVSQLDAADPLLTRVLNDARAQDAALIDFFCSNPRLSTFMRDHGFVSGESSDAAKVPLLFQPLDRRRTAVHFMAYLLNLPETSRPKMWHVTKSDGDQDRPN
jgi:hypothetical protein